MTIEQYQEQAKRTLPDLGTLEKNILHMRIGMLTEVGETLDIIKRDLAYGKPMDMVNLAEEIADVSWYICGLATIMKIRLFEVTDITPIKQPIVYELLTLDNRVHGEHPSLSLQGAMGLLKSIAQDFGFNFGDILQTNINKLKARFPEKFTQENALNRDLKKEREILESNQNY